MTQNFLAELNALGDGSGDMIYFGDKIVIGDNRATGHPGVNDPG